MSVTISRLLHAGYQIASQQTTVLFDPIFENPFSRNCHAFPSVEFNTEVIKTLKPDAVFISHHHDDHCSFESLNLLNRDIPIYMYCVHEEMFTMLKELGFKQVHSLTLDKPIRLRDLEVIPRRALDRYVDCLFQVKSQGLNILNVVDSWIDDDTLQLLQSESPWDLIMWPFQTMREVEVLSPARYKTEPQHLPEEWLTQIKLLNPKILIPSSCQFQMEPWSWYNQAFFPISYTQFSNEVTAVAANTQIYRLNPGTAFTLSPAGLTPAPPLKWIKPIGNQDVDYDYNLQVEPQLTSTIAKNFTTLTENEKSRIRLFCDKELADKYFQIGPSADPYFVKPRFWKLELYDHSGDKTEYHYKINEDSLTLCSDIPAQVDWVTEVPVQKLYAALEQGESLTSMYIRISCDDEEVDLIEDPLIRCLFSEGFATYQKAQLKKLKS